MKFSNSDIRRQDRLLDEKRAVELLLNSEYGVISMASESNSIYAVPINYVWDRKNSIYLHCAKEGRKLRCMDLNPKVSFCIVGNTNVLSSKFTTEYESIILECTARRNLLEHERMNALEIFIDKYSPMDKETGIKYARKSFFRTEIVRLDIEKWSGKSKKVNKH
ncbi:MAG: pyridoxamine 5'-phosphate oxidase family protein [Desulforegulaceae bacterium]|nr:pyridoxamine 5'-phosphate oxidase family protein [Desulforegulaceae bacterium]